MRYRIELSRTRKGFARVNLPGRVIALEASRQAGPVWHVTLTDLSREGSGSVSVHASDANDAVWRVARATVRAVSELSASPLEGELETEPEKLLSNFR